MTMLSERNLAQIEEINTKNLVYHITDESGEIFITPEDLQVAIDEIEEDLFMIYVDILVSGDPVREGIIDCVGEKQFNDFLLEFN